MAHPFKPASAEELAERGVGVQPKVVRKPRAKPAPVEPPAAPADDAPPKE